MKINLVLVLLVIILTALLFSVVFLGFKYNESSKQIEDLESKVMDYEFEINALKYNLDQTKKMIGADVGDTEVVYSTDKNDGLGFTFKSDELGFSFDYPSEWGEVNLEIVDALKSGVGDSGKSLTLSFSKSPKNKMGEDLAWGSGQSADFTAARGSRPTDFNGYPAWFLGGSKISEKSSVNSKIDAGSPGCTFQDGPLVTAKYQGIIYFNLPGKEIAGVQLIIPILSENDVNLIDEKFGNTEDKIKICSGGSDDPEFEKSLQTAEIIESTILSKEGLNEESKRNLDIFNEIVESAKVF